MATGQRSTDRLAQKMPHKASAPHTNCATPATTSCRTQSQRRKPQEAKEEQASAHYVNQTRHRCNHITQLYTNHCKRRNDMGDGKAPTQSPRATHQRIKRTRTVTADRQPNMMTRHKTRLGKAPARAARLPCRRHVPTRNHNESVRDCCQTRPLGELAG